MLRSVIISPDKRVAIELQSNLAEIPSVGLLRVFDHYPNSLEITRFVRAHAPEVIFLSVASLDQAAQIMQQLEAAAPGTQVIAIDGQEMKILGVNHDFGGCWSSARPPGRRG